MISLSEIVFYCLISYKRVDVDVYRWRSQFSKHSGFLSPSAADVCYHGDAKLHAAGSVDDNPAPTSAAAAAAATSTLFYEYAAFACLTAYDDNGAIFSESHRYALISVHLLPMMPFFISFVSQTFCRWIAFKALNINQFVYVFTRWQHNVGRQQHGHLHGTNGEQ